MKRSITTLMAALALGAVPLAAHAQGSAFSYQGRLNNGGNPANGSYDFTFALYDADAGGSAVTGTITNLATAITNGQFNTVLDFTSAPFISGAPVWLELAVRTNGGGAYSILAPRQAVLPTPYAIHAASVNASSLIGQVTDANLAATFSSPHAFTHPGSSFTGNGSGLTALNGSQVTSGTVADARLSSNVALRSGGNLFAGTQTVSNGLLSIQGTAPIGMNGSSLWVSGNDNGPLFTAGTPQLGIRLFNNSLAPGQSTIQGWDYFLNQARDIVINDGGGKVGIGTSSPSTALEVAGTVQATAFVGDGSGLTGLSNPNATNLVGIVPDAKLSGNVALRSGGNVLAGTQTVTNGLISLQGTAPIGQHGSSLWISGNDNGPLFTNGTPQLGIRVFNNSLAPGQSTIQGWDYSLNQGRDIVINDAGGKVGIGMNTPSTALEVGGTVKATTFVGDGSGISSLNASNLTGVIADAALSTNVAKRTGGNEFTGTQNVSGRIQMRGTAPIGSPGSSLWISGNDNGPMFTNGAPELGIRIFNNSLAPGQSTIQGWDYSLNQGRDIIINDAGGKVGIGTSSPSTALEVAGTVQAAAFVGDGSGLTGLANANATNLVGILPDAKLSSNVALRSGGNVLAGTQTVTNGLISLQGTAPIGQHGSSLWISGNDNGPLFTNGTPQLGIRIFNNSLAPGQSTVQGWDYSVNQARDIVINDAGGKVGIGTSSPSTALEVSGTVKATAFVGDGSGLTNLPSSGNVALLNGTNVFTGPNIINGNISATNLNNVIVGSFTGSGSGLTSLPAVQLTGSVPSAALTSVPAANLTGSVADARLSGNVALRSGGNSFSGSQSISSGNLSMISENVAFGIDAASNVRLGFIKKFGNGPVLASVPGEAIVFAHTDQSSVLANIGSSVITEEMRINPGGNVGIGTNNPSTKLEVAGTVKATAFVGDGSGLTNLPNATLSTNVALRSGGNTFNGTQVIASGSTLGIGTTSPLTPLEVRVTSGRNALFSGPNGANFSFYDVNGGGNPYLWDISGDTNAYAIAISGVGYPFLIKKSTGFVGINNGAPTTALDVGGTVKATAFVGDGSGLTNLPSSGNVALLNGTNVFTGPNIINGSISATNANNVIVGSFIGNGSGLTSLSAAQLTGSVPSGALTSLPAANLTGTVADARLSANVALLNGTNLFTGPNIFNGSISATNANNVIVGTFVGNGSGLTGLTVTSTNANATNLVGIVPDAKLSANVALRAGGNTFNGTQIITNGSVGIGTTSPGNTLMVNGTIGVIGAGLDGSTFQKLVVYADTNNGTLFEAPLNASNVKQPYHFNWRGGGTDAMTILGSGNIGIGTTTPGTKLDVVGQVRSSVSAGGAYVEMHHASGNGYVNASTGDLLLNDATSGNVLLGTGGGNVGINHGSPSAKLQVGGECKATVFTPTSDRNAKKDFTPIDPREVLEKVVALPITEWTYKDIAGARHMGPVAQDFRAAFGLGSDDKGISTVDADGVALASIQALNQKLNERDAEVQDLKQTVAELKKLVQSLSDKK